MKTSRSIFVTGTGTDVGKTVVAAGIAATLRRHGINVGVMKPVSTGGKRVGPRIISEDAQFLAQAAGVRHPMELINPIALEPALAPSIAAKLSHKAIHLERVWKAFKVLSSMHEVLVVEGVGGLMVPILDRYFVADMAQRMRLPIVIVTLPELGTINHTTLTAMAARQYGLEIRGLVVNNRHKGPTGVAEKLNPDALENTCNTPVLAEIPHLGSVGFDALKHEVFEELVNTL
jgi:dethiobiotin synthetase